MKKLLMIIISLACIFLTISNGVYACSDPNCSYERADQRSGTIKHFDKYGNLIGVTKGQ